MRKHNKDKKQWDIFLHFVSPTVSPSYLQSCPGNMQGNSAWRPGDKSPERSPVSPAPSSQAPVAAPDLHKTDGGPETSQKHTLYQNNKHKQSHETSGRSSLSPLLLDSGSGTCLDLLVQTPEDNALGSPHTSFPHTHPLWRAEMMCLG